MRCEEGIPLHTRIEGCIWHFGSFSKIIDIAATKDVVSA